jgi:hypothetical protein
MSWRAVFCGIAMIVSHDSVFTEYARAMQVVARNDQEIAATTLQSAFIQARTFPMFRRAIPRRSTPLRPCYVSAAAIAALFRVNFPSQCFLDACCRACCTKSTKVI